jgi:hypothetical protein
MKLGNIENKSDGVADLENIQNKSCSFFLFILKPFWLTGCWQWMRGCNCFCFVACLYLRNSSFALAFMYISFTCI